uniref:Fatty-acid amide hydrolase 1 n=1 Tax=Scophthalmus maximus TaxID=52904 RepID=A0A8D3CWB9_SCOMX
MEQVNLFLRRAEMDSRTAALLTAAACGAGAVVLLLRNMSRHRRTKDKIQRARNCCCQLLGLMFHPVMTVCVFFAARVFQHPTTNSALILTLSLSELTKQLQEGSLSPEDVFYTYMEKTLDVHKQLNCCTGILLESFDQLKTIDSNKKGLLYGVPVSIKENFEYKNQDCSCGVIINLDQPANNDGVLVEVLKRQGAIPFVKTNLPQGLLNYDCSNPIYGQTVNPHNLQKTSGGSSGGEGALIGGGGSPLGLGSDIGGSIRIPASFCGICGLKPTSGRLSSKGLRPIFRGQKSVSSSAGPMAKDVDSLALCMQALLCDHMFSLDPTVPPIPFNVEMYQSTKPLRIGYFESDGYMQASPSMTRAIREVKALLEQAGHTDYIHETIGDWRRCNIDVLLCPMIGPAYNFLYCGRVTPALSYTMLYNLLTFPAGVVPVSTVTAEDEEELKHYKGNYQDYWDKLFKKAVSGGEGLPVAVQCVALPWQDELCLRLMKEVEQLVKQSRG